MKRALAAAVTAAFLLLLAGCGGHTKTIRSATTAASSTVVTPSLHCDPADTVMPCILATQPPPPKLFSLAPGQLYGIDGFGPPSIGTLRAIHASFGAAYFSQPAGNPKNWTASAVRAYHAAHLGTVGVWETSANRAEQGFAAGRADALNYRALAAVVGDTAGPLRYAIDCDCSFAAIRGYFEGARSIGGGRTNAYGGYYQIRDLYNAHLVGHFNWQTYAWSRGLWLPASIAPLEQYLNGRVFDNDRALAANYGQWPAPVTDPFAAAPNTVRHFGKRPHRDHAREHNTVKTGLVRGCRLPVRRQVCRSTRAHEIELQHRIWVIATAHGRRHGKRARWGRDSLGVRFQYFASALAKR